MYMDDIKVFSNNEKEMNTLIQAIRIYNQDIEMEFSTENFAVLITKSMKRQRTERKEQQSQEIIRTFGEKENHKYLEIPKADTIKKKKKKKKDCSRRTTKPLQTKLHRRNTIKEVNTWAVPHHLVRYSWLFLKQTAKEIGQMDHRRKLMTMQKTLQPRDNVKRLYALRKERR